MTVNSLGRYCLCHSAPRLSIKMRSPNKRHVILIIYGSWAIPLSNTWMTNIWKNDGKTGWFTLCIHRWFYILFMIPLQMQLSWLDAESTFEMLTHHQANVFSRWICPMSCPQQGFEHRRSCLHYAVSCVCGTRLWETRHMLTLWKSRHMLTFCHQKYGYQTLALSSLNLPLPSSSTTSRELLSQFS